MTTLDLDAWEMFAEINVGRGYPGQAFLSNTQTLALIAEVKALREKVAAVEAIHSKTQRPQIAGCTCGEIICQTLAALNQPISTEEKPHD